MKIQDFKKENYAIADFSAEAILRRLKKNNKAVAISAGLLLCFTMILFVSGILSLVKNNYNNTIAETILPFSVNFASTASSGRNVISIPSGIVKTNPFLPYRNVDGLQAEDNPIFEIIAPPEVLNEDSEASRVMDTVVSGILFDNNSPSAILNIEGNDYLVKKGDTINNYKILDIQRDSVTVRLGANTYKAGIGEILTEGTLNYNDVSNLSSKFGGEK